MNLIFIFLVIFTVNLPAVSALDSLAPQAIELDHSLPIYTESKQKPLYPPRRLYSKLYDEVVINDPQPQSAGFYVRLSQKGANYFTELASEGLPSLLTKIVLPTVDLAAFKGENFVITKFEKPKINATFMEKTGVSLKIYLPHVEVEGDCSVDLLFTAGAHMKAVMRNWTILMDVSILREIGDERNTINVTRCEGSVPVKIQFFGGSAESINPFADLIGKQIESAIKSKLCIIPEMLNAFFEKQQEEILSEQFWNETIVAEKSGAVGPKIEDHICSDLFGPIEDEEGTAGPEGEHTVTGAPDEPVDGLDEFGNNLNDIGVWAPDLTLRFPPTFSKKDVIVGIDAGIVLNGHRAKVERPKFHNVTVIRDQMAGVIISEYVPNTFLYHVFDKSLGSFVESFNLKNVPKSLRPFARIICSGCMVILKANLTQKPHVSVDRNGIMLLIEGDVSAHFYRKNKTHELLGADGVIKVQLKPQFRNSRIYSDVELNGVDFKVYKVGIGGMFASSARKLLNFIIPKTIWPRVQKSLRFAINRRGIKLPSVCGIQFEKLHVDYIRHAAMLSADFTVDLPFFIDSFKRFIEADLKHADGVHEYDRSFRYL